LKIAYLLLIAGSFFVIFQMPGSLLRGFIGVLLVSVGTVRLADWFLCRRLEPGTPGDSPNFWT